MGEGPGKNVALEMLWEVMGAKDAQILTTKHPEIARRFGALIEDSAERGRLRRFLGIPDHATVRNLDERVVFTTPETCATDNEVPPTAVVDYLCRRVAALEEELGQTRARRAEAVNRIEEQRVERQEMLGRLKEIVTYLCDVRDERDALRRVLVDLKREVQEG